MATMQYWIILVCIFILSCSEKDNSEIITFHEIIIPPFSPNFTSDTILSDSTMSISLIDGNNNGTYTDSTIPLDYINVSNNFTTQSTGIGYTSPVHFNYGNKSYIFSYDSITRTGHLKPVDSIFISPDINIFSTIPNFSLINIDDTTNRVSFNKLTESISKKYILIEFWATFCPPCIEEMESYHLNNSSFEESDLAIIFVTPISTYSRTEEFLANKPYRFPIYYVDEPTQNNLNCTGYPRGILASNTNGYIRHFNFSGIDYVATYVSTLK